MRLPANTNVGMASTTIWTAAAIGIVAGAGNLLLATLIGVLSLLTLEIRYIPVLRLLDGRRHIAKMSDDSPPEGM